MMGVEMAKNGRGKAASKRSSRGKKSKAETKIETKVLSERYTPLLSREDFTFMRMRVDRGGPRTYSAICLPGWVQA